VCELHTHSGWLAERAPCLAHLLVRSPSQALQPPASNRPCPQLAKAIDTEDYAVIQDMMRQVNRWGCGWHRLDDRCWGGL